MAPSILRLTCLFLLLMAGQALGAPERTPSLVHAGSIEFGGRTRTFLYYLPANLKEGQHPLLIALHGGGGDAKSMVKTTFERFNELADQEGFLVVYPEGVGHHWNDGRDTPDEAHRKGVDDVGFIRALVALFQAAHGVDPRRVYATGISNGAFMSVRLACEMSDLLAAAAPVAGSLSEALSSTCHPEHPLPMMFINGDQDPLVPYGGGDVKILWFKRGKILPVQEAALYFAKLGGCDLPSKDRSFPDIAPDDGTTLSGKLYSNPKTGLEVALYTLHGGGHTWPMGWQYLRPRTVGRVSMEMDACSVIWEFFKSHPKK